MRRSARAGVAGVLTALALGAARGQPAQPRPKVGLALSGGSAYGLAHVGVLKWLDEHRVPVEAVAGTSMGGLLGGLLAVGKTPTEIEDYLRQIDWNETLQVAVPFRQLSYRRKEDQREYPNTIELGWKKGQGLRFPSALSSGHGVDLAVARFAAQYSGMASFDDLPTPFRCVSVDLVKGQQVVFRDGSLGEALRATMSIPGVFAPVRKDGMLLVDGGMLNNLPVDVVRQMGAELVIAVALNPPVPPPEQINTLFGVARRSLSVMVSDNERRNLGLADLVIMPDLDGFGATDYPRWEELEQRGYEAAEKKKFLLDKLSVSEGEYTAWKQQRAARRRPEELKPDRIVVDQKLAPHRRETLLDVLRPRPGAPLARETLESELTGVTGMGRFDAATYSVVQQAGEEILRLKVHEKDHGPPFIKPSFLLDASPEDGLRFGVGMRVTFLDAGGPASEWRTDLSLGLFNRAATEYYYRLGGGKWFIAPRLGYDDYPQPFYEGKKRLAEFTQRSTGGGVDLGYAFGRFQELRLGWTLAHRRAEVLSGQEVAQAVRGRASTIRVKWAYEGQDSPNVPRRGLRVWLDGAWALDWPEVNRRFPMFEGLVSWAHPLPRHWLFLGQAQGGSTVDENILRINYNLGGPLRMSALARSQLLGSHYYYGGGYIMRSLTNEALSLFGRFYALAAYEAGTAWFDQRLPLPHHSGTLGVMGETQFGVVFFGGAIGDRGERKLFFRLGRFF